MIAILLIAALLLATGGATAKERDSVALQTTVTQAPTCSPRTKKPITSRPTLRGHTYHPTNYQPCGGGSTDGDAYAFYITAHPTTKAPTGVPTAVPV